MFICWSFSINKSLGTLSYAFSKSKKTTVAVDVAHIFLVNCSSLAYFNISSILWIVELPLVKPRCHLLNIWLCITLSKLCNIVVSNNFVMVGRILIGLVLFIWGVSLKLFRSYWNYKIFNKNGVFHTTSCEVVQTILMISESVLMLKTLSRKEHNIESTKREIKNSLLVGTNRENVRWTPYY